MLRPSIFKPVQSHAPVTPRWLVGLPFAETVGVLHVALAAFRKEGTSVGNAVLTRSNTGFSWPETRGGSITVPRIVARHSRTTVSRELARRSQVRPPQQGCCWTCSYLCHLIASGHNLVAFRCRWLSQSLHKFGTGYKRRSWFSARSLHRRSAQGLNLQAPSSEGSRQRHAGPPLLRLKVGQTNLTRCHAGRTRHETAGEKMILKPT